MNEQKRKKIVYVCLVLVIIFGAYNLYFSKDKKTNQAALQQEQLAAQQEVFNQTIQKTTIDTLKYNNMKWGNDPFRAIQMPVATNKTVRVLQHTQWILSGIMYKKTNPTAIINNTPVHIGDSIDNAVVVEINKNNVVLNKNGELVKLTIS